MTNHHGTAQSSKLNHSDYFTDRRLAEGLALRLEDYWIREGYQGIDTHIEAINQAQGEVSGYAITSNIGTNGYPPRKDAA